MKRSSRSTSARVGAGALDRALEALYAAEASDWTWWYGDDHSSGIDEVFDELFRGHIETIYRELGLQVPGEVFGPISAVGADVPDQCSPLTTINPILDGRTHFFEWQGLARSG